MCPQVGSEKLESILIGDNDRPMLEIATVGAQGGSEGALIRSTAGRLLIGWHPSCLCGGFCALCYDALRYWAVNSGAGALWGRGKAVLGPYAER